MSNWRQLQPVSSDKGLEPYLIAVISHTIPLIPTKCGFLLVWWKHGTVSNCPTLVKYYPPPPRIRESGLRALCNTFVSSTASTGSLSVSGKCCVRQAGRQLGCPPRESQDTEALWLADLQGKRSTSICSIESFFRCIAFEYECLISLTASLYSSKVKRGLSSCSAKTNQISKPVHI